MYAIHNKKIKTDKRDAQALCESCRLGAYREAHRTSEEQRQIKSLLAVREALVQTRARYITVIKTRGSAQKGYGCIRKMQIGS
jgi:transposase